MLGCLTRCRDHIKGAFEQSLLHVWEIYPLENVVFYIAVYGLYKPYISHAHVRNTECSNAPESTVFNQPEGSITCIS